MRNDGACVQIQGRAATNPTIMNSAGGAERVSFRIVSNERRYDEGTSSWVDANEFGTTVVCWRGVAAGVLKTVRKGDPLLVIGRLSTRRFERNNVTAYFTDVRGDVVALDVARIGNRIIRSGNDRDTPEGPEGPEAAEGAGGHHGPIGSVEPTDIRSGDQSEDELTADLELAAF